jgi:hypothetical protein
MTDKLQQEFETWFASTYPLGNLERDTEEVLRKMIANQAWEASRANFDDLVMRPILEAMAKTAVKQIVQYADLLAAAERYLAFRHTSDIGMGTEYSGVHPETELKNAIAKAKGVPKDGN